MNIDLLGDWPAYLSMAVFIGFVAYILVTGSKGSSAAGAGNIASAKTEEIKKK